MTLVETGDLLALGLIVDYRVGYHGVRRAKFVQAAEKALSVHFHEITIMCGYRAFVDKLLEVLYSRQLVENSRSCSKARVPVRFRLVQFHQRELL